MGNDDSNNVSRRDTLRLATAVSALGLGLGVVFDGKDADAQVLKGAAAAAATTIKLEASQLGPVSLKLYKLDADGRSFDLLHTLDLSALFMRGEGKESAVSIKLFNHKAEQPTLIAQQNFRLVQQKG